MPNGCTGPIFFSGRPIAASFRHATRFIVSMTIGLMPKAVFD
jgi:hypothetical protein